ncbi:MAG: bifunctional riboflavin kinase/FAD synthetase, partial [Saprospiraceae bacterium]
MKVHRDLSDLPQFHNAVVTIGSFDGVHMGHQKILKKVKDLALATGGESIVITFHPHPRQIVYPKDTSLKLITTTEEKIELLAKSGIDHLVIVPFTFEFSQISADEYIERFLVTKFHPKYIVIGYDHRFGLNRRGDISYLRWHEATCGYEVREIEKQEIDAAAVSSSKVRQFLINGAVKPAAHLMGHFFSLRGKVVKGQQIGTSIGFPTANIELQKKVKLVPPDGIYAAYAIYEEQRHWAMLYIGSKPTIKGYNKRAIEVHIFDFNSEIYEDELQVELVDFIRHDATFKDIESLRRKLEEDKIRSEEILARADLLVKKWEQQQLPSVAVVILNFNGKKFLEKYLPAVLRTTYPNMEVIVADNASKDDSIPFLQEHFPQVGIIQLQQNHGFAKGYNLALQDLDSDYFVLLNSDVDTPENWLEPLVSVLESDKSIAAVQPKIRAISQPEYFEYAGAAGGWIDFLGYPFCRGRIFDTVEKDRGQYDHPTEIFWASGCCMAVRAPLFNGFGGFDAEFFAHLEEIDLCWRFKRAGYKIMFTPRSVVYHLGGGTLAYNSPYKTYLNFRNSYYTLLKNESILKLAFLLPIRVMMDTVAAISFLAK